MSKQTLFSWSSGKDSAWALHVLQHDPDIQVVGLFSTVNQQHQRVAMHAVRVELLQRQADAVGLPLQILPIPHPCSNEQYGSIMNVFLAEAQKRHIECIAFGDLFLQEVRDYRENALKETGITPIFPLWQRPTNQLIRQMLSEGLRAVITCIDPRQLPATFIGRELSSSLLAELPHTADPCGENGEYHTFVTNGPMFHYPIEVQTGEVVERDGFVFLDLLPNGFVPTPAH